MSIKAVFSTGESTKTTTSLHQWDYGQVLEIESADLPSTIEVHFACRNMDEAVAHVCSAPNGVAQVLIPDVCLEQTTPITAWVYAYENDGTTGATIKTIEIPVISRVRPKKTREIPQQVSDRYTELIAEVEELLGTLRSGETVVNTAVNASYATAAGTANTAGTAGHAESATTADSATNATNDKNGKDISETYLKKSDQKCLRINKVFPSKYFQKDEEIELCEMPSGFDVGDIWSVSFAIGTSPEVETEQYVGVNTSTVSGTIANRTLYMCCNLSRTGSEFTVSGLFDIGRIEITLTRRDGKLYLTPLARKIFTILSSVITDGANAGSNVIESNGLGDLYLHHVYIYFKGV